MGFPDFFRDAKNILLGRTDDDDEIDFEATLKEAKAAGIIDEKEAKVLENSINKLKLDAKEFDKKQISSIALEDESGSYYKQAKEKEEKERKRREKIAMQRAATENARIANANRAQKREIKQDATNGKSQNNRVKIDRNKIINEMKKEEREENIRNLQRDDKNNKIR